MPGVLALVALLGAGAPVWGSGPAPRAITLDVKEADIHNVFRLLSLVGGTNIVVAEGVTGRVTLRLDGVRWADAFQAVLVSEGLGVEKIGNVMLVDTLEHITERAGQRRAVVDAEVAAAPLRTVMIPVNYASAEELAVIIAEVLSERGSVSVDSRTNTLIVTDVAENLGRVESLAE